MMLSEIVPSVKTVSSIYIGTIPQHVEDEEKIFIVTTVFLCLCKFETFAWKKEPQQQPIPSCRRISTLLDTRQASSARRNSGVIAATNNLCNCGGYTRLCVNICWRLQSSCPWRWLTRSRSDFFAAIILSSWWLVWNPTKDNKENSLSWERKKWFLGMF